MNTFTNPNDPANVQIIAAIKNWTIERLAQQNKAPVNVENIAVHEIKCAEPGCLFFETQIRIETEDQPQHFIIAKPLVYIRKPDVAGMKPAPSSTTLHSHLK